LARELLVDVDQNLVEEDPAGSQGFFQQSSQPFVLGLQFLILAPELRDLFGNVSLPHARLTRIVAAAITFRAASTKALNNYNKSSSVQSFTLIQSLEKAIAHSL
jgi:hypothetical protein